MKRKAIPVKGATRFEPHPTLAANSTPRASECRMSPCSTGIVKNSNPSRIDRSPALSSVGHCDFLDSSRKSRMSTSSMTVIARMPGVTCTPANWNE